MKRKNKITVLLLIIIITSCSINKMDSLKFQSIKTTLIEVGSMQASYDIKEMEKLYKNSELTFSKNNKYLLLKKSDKTVDSISLFYNRNKIHDILSNVELNSYPTDNFNKCYISKGINCDISKKLLDIIGIKNPKDITIQIGKSLNLENNYMIFYENEYVYLVSENEMAILTYK
jgi:hypothetical protein